METVSISDLKWSNIIATCNGTTNYLIKWRDLLQSSEKDSWPLTKELSIPLGNLEQFSQHFFAHTILINYWSEKRIRALKDLSMNLYLPKDCSPSLPQIYFEVENTDALFYIEFHPGTEKIICGRYQLSREEIAIVLPDITTIRAEDYKEGLLVNIRKVDVEEVDAEADRELVNARNQLYSHIICFGTRWQVKELEI